MVSKIIAMNTTKNKETEGYAADISPQLAYQWWVDGHAHLVDIRSDAERTWVGFVPNAPSASWKIWPGMSINPEFDAELRACAPIEDKGARVMLLCRSGIRSIAAAQQAQSLGYEAYNILEGFEGDPDANSHRGTRGGWRYHALPWRQS